MSETCKSNEERLLKAWDESGRYDDGRRGDFVVGSDADMK